MTDPGIQDDRIGIAILGSTGSVGRQALEVISAHPSRFRIVALAARTRSPLLLEQIARFRPELVSVSDSSSSDGDAGSETVFGNDGLVAAATHPAADIIIVATSGHAAILPTIRALEARKTIALANKEVLVCAGEIIMPLAQAQESWIRPVDSEHSAIWQALSGGASLDQIRRVVITASGGPFRTTPASAFGDITAKAALAHPTWSMGGKISIDSATMMNKGLEVIEAHWLFDLPYDRIDVVVHPESIVHSLVEFVDGGLIAQLGLPDMKLPIQYALTHPDRAPLPGQRLDLLTMGALHFEPPDEERFPALRLAREAGRAGRTYPTALSAADDEAVSAFLGGVLRFVDIPAVIEEVLDCHEPHLLTLDSLWEADESARRAARRFIEKRRPS